MKSEMEKFYREYDGQSIDIIKGILNVPSLLAKLEAFEAKFEEIKLLMQKKAQSQNSQSGGASEWTGYELVSVKKCAEIIDQSERTVRNLVKRGFLEQSKATRHIKITVRSIIAYVDRTV